MKVGMYVRCPIDGNKTTARIFYFGQIININEDNVAVVAFHDPRKLRSFFVELPDSMEVPVKLLSHISSLDNIKVKVNGENATILTVCQKGGADQFTSYFVEFNDKKIKEILEKDIEIPFTKANYNPVFQMLHYELQSPQWFLNRMIVSESLNTLNNSPFGFKNLLGTRVNLYTHQVDTVIRALSEKPCRLMLADEVGLGKTIEAMAIIKGMMDRDNKFCSLIVVPETLIFQWQTEITYKFWCDAPIWGIDNTCDIEKSNIVLISHKSLVKDYKSIVGFKKWSMCVVDETHRLINNEYLFKSVLELCSNINNVLLLSATPILNREEEYFKLLSLLNPKRFVGMPTSKFNELLNKQKNIQDIVFDLMRDIPDYIEYDLFEDFKDSLNEINEEIKDEKLSNLISQIDENAEDKGLSQIKLVLAYIAEIYQIERGIIRHRRIEIDSANIKRKLTDISYELVGSDKGFFEEETYNSVTNLVEEVLNENKYSIKPIKDILAAVFSSPYAVDEILDKYNDILKEYDLSDIKSNLKKWEKAYDEEINNITKVSDYIEKFNSKFSKIIDYIDQEDYKSEKKFLVFTSFNSTAKKLEECFKKFFGENSTCSFYKGKTPIEMQEAATMFQDDANCRFMISDETGGEGRNFQIADYIVNIDLPWSPALLEQRIGRLDRIGRDNKDVNIIVVHSENTLENDLFEIYNKGLGIFNNSLCGMEIAFEEIHNSIEKALSNDIRYGLADEAEHVLEFSNKMQEEIEKERYYDLARQLDSDLENNLVELIFKFTNNDGAELMNTMMAWPHLAGFMGMTVSDKYNDGSKILSIDTVDLSIKSMENSLYFPPKMDDIIKKSKVKNEILGTFSRKAAVKHENLAFYAPYNPLFDSIIENAEECYRGRCTALRSNKSSLNWMGFILVWNVKFNPIKLYKNGYSSDLINLVSEFMPTKQFVFTRGANPEFDSVDSNIIVDELKQIKWKNPTHLGKRSNGSLEKFCKRYPKETWDKLIKGTYVRSQKFIEENLSNYIDVDRAKDKLEGLNNAQMARSLFYGDIKDKKAINKDEIEALIYGLENPILELDSIAYLELIEMKSE